MSEALCFSKDKLTKLQIDGYHSENPWEFNSKASIYWTHPNTLHVESNWKREHIIQGVLKYIFQILKQILISYIHRILWLNHRTAQFKPTYKYNLLL